MTPKTIAATLDTLCDLAKAETMHHFRSPLTITNKLQSGFDPVTIADQAAETAITDYLVRHFPDHGILGEEHAPVNPGADYCWIIDPIDGTRAFISGLPTWGTLIGLSHKGKPVAGVMHQPFTGEKYMSDGTASFLEHAGSRTGLKTSPVTSLTEATLMSTSPELFKGGELESFTRICGACRLVRYGFDCYAYAMVAAGHVELVVESGLKAYDIAALIPVIENAGGVVVSWSGGNAAEGGQVLAAANREIAEKAIKLLTPLT